MHSLLLDTLKQINHPFSWYKFPLNKHYVITFSLSICDTTKNELKITNGKPTLFVYDYTIQQKIQELFQCTSKITFK